MTFNDKLRRDTLDVLTGLKACFESLKLSGINYYYLQKPVISCIEKGEQPAGYDGKKSQLERLQKELCDCMRCKLNSTRTNIVFGEGNPDARLVFVGEAPGGDEDLQGRPFVGKAGQLLTKIINAINLKRTDVYIANIVKCRPPQNRDPADDEIQTCVPFLKRQIEIIMPDIICSLGRIATRVLLETDKGITELRGKFHNLGDIKVMPTYHPSFLLRNEDKKRDAWIDMQKVQKEYFKK